MKNDGARTGKGLYDLKASKLIYTFVNIIFNFIGDLENIYQLFYIHEPTYYRQLEYYLLIVKQLISHPPN